jgi:hypothetical protein
MLASFKGKCLTCDHDHETDRLEFPLTFTPNLTYELVMGTVDKILGKGALNPIGQAQVMKFAQELVIELYRRMPESLKQDVLHVTGERDMKDIVCKRMEAELDAIAKVVGYSRHLSSPVYMSVKKVVDENTSLTGVVRNAGLSLLQTIGDERGRRVSMVKKEEHNLNWDTTWDGTAVKATNPSCWCEGCRSYHPATSPCTRAN